MKTLRLIAFLSILFTACKKDIQTGSTSLTNISADALGVSDTASVFIAGLHTIDQLNTVTGAVTALNQFDVNVRGTTETPVFYKNNLLMLAGKELVSKAYPAGSTNWSVILNDQNEGTFASSALCVAGNTVYVSMHFRSTQLSGSERLFAINANTGKIKWKQIIKLDPYNDYLNPYIKTPDKLSPVFSNGVIYFPSSDTLYAYTAEGSLLWKFVSHSSNKYDNYGHQFNPTVGNGMVFFAAGTATDAATQDSLFAVDAATGALVWKKTFNMGIDAACIYKNDKLYVNGSNGVYCLDPLTGKEVWKYQVRSFSVSPLVVTDTAVYATVETHSRVYAINAVTGVLNWSIKNYDNYLDFSIEDGVLAKDGKVFVRTKNTLFRAFDAATGNVVWESPLTFFTNSTDSPGLPIFFLDTNNNATYSAEIGMD